jgi:hypothetical protein
MLSLTPGPNVGSGNLKEVHISLQGASSGVQDKESFFKTVP